MIIKAPASTANLGPGFDSVGMAVSLYLKVEIIGKSEKWIVDHPFKGIPSDERNMIVQVALKTCSDLKPQRLKVTSNIPLSHGLGSSSSAIAAGIELANQLANLNMSNEEKVELASQIEGHPDNVAPTILGGLVVGSMINGHFDTVKLPLPPFDFVAYIPDYNLATKNARAVLPKEMAFSKATYASSIANTFVASLAMKKYDQVGELMEADHFHEPFRSELVPELRQIREIGKKSGALATYLSGAGSTVMTVTDPEFTQDFIDDLRKNGLKARVEKLNPDQDGIQVIK
ncbi:homoserine kinase [Lactobacillus kalixensis]|uniref:Homoserine kinase n=1 Tax=Lactobacillus kalixensis DSM 16043 TaxID=1423763 RepID=A0A0R1UHM3_9LACO|nr:homoserine kinase [Lactobacillus kalixensis]KRL90584.1 homoserine kinase [Lactobacillus kalixensis DSM 16043]